MSMTTKMAADLRAIYSGTSRETAREYALRLHLNAERATSALAAVEAAANSPVEISDELFDSHRDELERARRTGATIEWLAVGDPCFHVLVPARGETAVAPSYLAEHAHTKGARRVWVVAYEVWLSRLCPVYADHWYRVDYDLASRTTTYTPLPESRTPRVAARIRRALSRDSVRYDRLSRAACSMPLDYVPRGLRRRAVNVFELAFSTTASARLVFSASGYESRRLRFGSTFAPPSDEPTALAAAFPEIGASWKEELDPSGKPVSRELVIHVPHDVTTKLVRVGTTRA